MSLPRASINKAYACHTLESSCHKVAHNHGHQAKPSGEQECVVLRSKTAPTHTPQVVAQCQECQKLAVHESPRCTQTNCGRGGQSAPVLGECGHNEHTVSCAVNITPPIYRPATVVPHADHSSPIAVGPSHTTLVLQRSCALAVHHLPQQGCHLPLPQQHQQLLTGFFCVALAAAR